MLNETTIVYVEDDPLSREIMTMLVENIVKPRLLITLEDSSNFVSRINAIDPVPTLFLLDIQVKPYNGFQMLNLLRNEQKFKQSKAIALTASVMNEQILQLRECGFNGAIAKPLSIQAFPGLLKRIISGETVWHISD